MSRREEHNKGLLELNVALLRLDLDHVRAFGGVQGSPPEYRRDLVKRRKETARLSDMLGENPPPILREVDRALGGVGLSSDDESNQLGATLSLRLVGRGEKGRQPNDDRSYTCLFDLNYPPRRSGGLFQPPWTEEELQDLRQKLSYRARSGDDQEIYRAGSQLRVALSRVPDLEGSLAHFSEARTRRLIVQAHDSDVLRLPWELLTLSMSRGELPFVLGVGNSLERQLSRTKTIKVPQRLGSDPGSLVLGWSQAGGPVPFEESCRLLRGLCEKVNVDFLPLPEVSLRSLSNVGRRATERNETVSVVELLCHGAKLNGPDEAWGLKMAGSAGSPETVNPFQLAGVIQSDFPALELLVLYVCDSGNPGSTSTQSTDMNVFGSLVEATTLTGVTTIASQFPLSKVGAVLVMEVLNEGLLVDRDSIEESHSRAIRELHRDLGAQFHDWASLVLFKPR